MTTKPPHGTQEWLDAHGNGKRPGETDDQHGDRMRLKQAVEIDAISPIVRNPKTGATAMIMPGLPEDKRPSGRRVRI